MALVGAVIVIFLTGFGVKGVAGVIVRVKGREKDI
jgi:hypothetical protein